MAKRNWSTERYQLIVRSRTGFKGSGAMFFTLVQVAEIMQMVHIVQVVVQN